MNNISKYLVKGIFSKNYNIINKATLSEIKDPKHIINYNINKDKKVFKIRNIGVDLLRIVSMYGIIICHTLGHGGGYIKYRKYDKLFLLDAIFNWHIIVFGIISGIVGYRTYKYSNLLYLWICVTFYSVIINLYYQKYKPLSVINDKLYSEFFPVIYNKYWYFTKYFGMYLFLSLINKGIEYLTKSELKILVMSLYGVIIIWRYSKNKILDAFSINNGNSIIWFIILYITGGYIGKYNLIYNGIRKVILCLIYLIIFIFTTIIIYYLPRYNLYNIKSNYIKKIIILIKSFIDRKFDSIPKIIQSISITLFLIQIKYNKYLAKIISFFGPLTFGIYLIHDNKLVRKNKIRKMYNSLPNNLPLNSVIKYTFIKVSKIFFLCSIFDYIRHRIFILFKIRKICIFLEKTAFKILG